MSGTAHVPKSQDGSYRFGFRGADHAAGRLVTTGPLAVLGPGRLWSHVRRWWRLTGSSLPAFSAGIGRFLVFFRTVFSGQVG